MINYLKKYFHITINIFRKKCLKVCASHAENEKTTKRKPNWTDEDSKTLVMLVVEKSEVLFTKFSTTITSEKKKTVWESITKQ